VRPTLLAIADEVIELIQALNARSGSTSTLQALAYHFRSWRKADNRLRCNN
jgi:hypothetical protein